MIPKWFGGLCLLMLASSAVAAPAKPSVKDGPSSQARPKKKGTAPTTPPAGPPSAKLPANDNPPPPARPKKDDPAPTASSGSQGTHPEVLDEAARKREILKGFYEALDAVAQAHASDTFTEAMAFVKGGLMEKAAVKTLILASKLELPPDEYEVRSVLAKRKAEDLPQNPCSFSFGRLTCLFDPCLIKNPRPDPKHPGHIRWEAEPITDVQRGQLWNLGSQKCRHDVILARFGQLFGKDMKSYLEECPRCHGDGHSAYNTAGRMGKKGTCPRCRGIGGAVTVEFR